MEALVGAACMATGKPVFLRYDYQQHITYTGKRSPFWLWLKFGADADGKLAGHGERLVGRPRPVLRVRRPADAPGRPVHRRRLRHPAIRGVGRTVCTNHIWGSAFRAYGSPQSFLASESLMDELAEKMGVDPFELRYRNIYRPGATTPTGQTPEVFSFEQQFDILRPKYQAALAKAQRESTAEVKKGVGVSLGIYGCGLDGPDASEVAVELTAAGVSLYNSWEDHGQGADAGGLGTAHEALRPLGIAPDKIKLVMNDTAVTPNSGPSGGSRQQVMTGNAIVNGCQMLLNAMKKSDGTYRTYDEMVAENIPLRYDGKWTASMNTACDGDAQGSPFAVYMYGVFMAEVAVDTKTGKATVEKYTAVGDVGSINNQLVVDGQMYGGIAQGIGLALSEDCEDLSKHKTLVGCGLPYIGDIPDDIELDLRPDPEGARSLRRGRSGRTPADLHPCGRHQRHQERHRRAHHPPAGPAREDPGGSAGASEVATASGGGPADGRAAPSCRQGDPHVDKSELQQYERRCIQEEPAECVVACPLRVDARSFVIHVAGGAWEEAWKTLRKTMPFPGILGRICDHPCELRCTRKDLGDAIQIGALERACVATPAPEHRLVLLPRRDQTVAVVGSGLASLTAAWDLARKGYPVSVFEPGERVGGRLLELPEDLLPREVIVGEVAVLDRLGVEFAGGPVPTADALRDGFGAVFWGLDGGLGLGGADRGSAPPTGPASPSGSGPQPDPDGRFLTGGAGDSPIGWALEGRRAATTIDRFLQGASLSAGRASDGPQPTRLVVSLAGREPLTAVRPAVPAAGFSPDEAREEAARCLRCECLECVKVCTYLEHFGSYPRRYAREVYNNASIVQGERKSNLLVNSCMLCGLCTAVCPEDFSMPDLCLGARREMVGRGKMPPSAHEFALEDLAWSRSDAFALARNEPGTATSAYAFYPGCQLAGSNPTQVERAYEHLRAGLPGGVGLLLDCCGAPARWAGREDLFDAGVTGFLSSWERPGRPVVVFALSHVRSSPDSAPAGGWVAVPRRCAGAHGVCHRRAARGPRPVRALHDPCTSRQNADMQAGVRRLLGSLGQPVEELVLSGETTECCGYGGLQANANPDLARRVAERRAGESPAEYVTYCAMCRDSLAATGKRAIHLLDLLFPGESDPAARPRPGWSERRENRARLREGLLATVWCEQGGQMEASGEVELVVSPEVQEHLDARRILADDVRQVIEHAERTGERLCHPVTGHYLASFRPRTATFWVEYAPEGNGYRVHNAYAHRMTAELGVG